MMANKRDNELLTMILSMTAGFGLVSGTLACTTAVETYNGDFIASSGDYCESFSETPRGATITTAVGSVGVTSSLSQDGPDAVIEVFFKNQVPYTATEKRAERVYGALHRKEDASMRKPVLIADSQETLETVRQVFVNARGERAMEKLDLFEELLKGLPH